MRNTVRKIMHSLKANCRGAAVGVVLTGIVALLLAAVPMMPTAGANDGLSAGSIRAMAASRQSEAEEVVYLYVDGVMKTVNASGVTVADILKDAGVMLAADDRVEPTLSEVVADGSTVSVYRVKKTQVTTDELVPHTVIRNPSQYIAKGEETLKQAGADGRKTVVYEVVYENGVEVSRRTISETVTKAPVDKIVEYGSGGTIVTPDGQVLSYTKKMTIEATAYTTEGATWKRTFSGTVARVGAIAVDPKTIPLGTSVYVSSADGSSWVYGTAVCEDTGGAIKGNIIDLFFDTRRECFQFGRRAGVLYILET